MTDPTSEHVPTPWQASDLIAWRDRMGFTQGKAAEWLNVSLRGYQKRELGESPISRETILACIRVETHRERARLPWFIQVKKVGGPKQIPGRFRAPSREEAEEAAYELWLDHFAVEAVGHYHADGETIDYDAEAAIRLFAEKTRANLTASDRS